MNQNIPARRRHHRLRRRQAALVNLTKTLAQEFGRHGVRVNAVSPGPVATDLWLGEHGVAATVAMATGVDADTARQTIIAGIGGFATGRFTTPEEVATLIAYLASDRAGNVTGANPAPTAHPAPPPATACSGSARASQRGPRPPP